MKTIALNCFLALLAVSASWGMAFGLTLPDASNRADIVAHIRVDDDLEVSPRFKHTRNADGSVTVSSSSDDPNAYTKIATASVVRAIKGYEGSNPIKIRHTNGFGCPNVIYQKGKEYIVFLRKEPGSDYYVTMNFYAGQFKIENGQVVAFYLMHGYKHPDDLRLPYERVITFLTESIQKQKG